MRVLRRGMSGPDVKRWQNFLRGEGHRIVADGVFGKNTAAHTKSWQAARGLVPDGVVGPKTRRAARSASFAEKQPASVRPSRQSPAWPPKPTDLRPLGASGRTRVYGVIRAVAAPTASNPERVQMQRDFKLVRVPLPGIERIGGPSAGVFFHAKAAPNLEALWRAWKRERLLGRLLSYAGTYAPRFIRGSKTTLSSHAWGTAIDFNAAWNGLGKVPARLGERGCVRELVPLAREHGFYWGGWFRRGDGMHFECVRPEG